MAHSEDIRKRLDAGQRVSPRPKKRGFGRNEPDPWLQVKHQDNAARVAAWRKRLPKQ